MSKPVKPIPTTRSPWREPMVWLVLAWPAWAVIAGVATVVLALRYPDPPLSTLPAKGAKTGQVEQAVPAMQGRNHAATGVPGARP